MGRLITEDMYPVAIPLLIKNDSSTFKCGYYSGFVREFHIYMKIRKPLVGEYLECVREATNELDTNAVAVVRTN